MIEDQDSVATWARDTFGAPTVARAATRMNQEVAELLAQCSIGDRDKIKEECADVLIVLYVLADQLSMDIHEAVDKKMAVNRQREWKLDGSGCGQHV